MELLEVKGTTRERGDLLFSSCQVIEGIGATIDNAKGAKEQPLADRFASDIIDELPNIATSRAAVVNPLDGTPTVVKVGKLSSERTRICGEAPPSLMESFVLWLAIGSSSWSGY